MVEIAKILELDENLDRYKMLLGRGKEAYERKLWNGMATIHWLYSPVCTCRSNQAIFGAICLTTRILVGQFWRISFHLLFHGCFLYRNIIGCIENEQNLVFQSVSAILFAHFHQASHTLSLGISMRHTPLMKQ